MKKETILEIIKNGGGSLNKKGLVNLKSGYMVSLPNYEEQYKLDNIDNVIKGVEEKLKSLKRGEYVGFWVNNGILYLDISKRENTLKEAIYKGKLYNQLAIWNNRRGCEIALRA